MVKNGLKFLGNLVLCILMSVYYSIKYIFTGKAKIIRCVDIIAYGIFGWCMVCAKNVACITVILLVILESIFVIWIMKDKGNRNSTKENEKKYQEMEESFFAGMEADVAKETYRKLLKQYHPDNINGDSEVTRKIIQDYREYCSMQV